MAIDATCVYVQQAHTEHHLVYTQCHHLRTCHTTHHRCTVFVLYVVLRCLCEVTLLITLLAYDVLLCLLFLGLSRFRLVLVVTSKYLAAAHAG